MSSPAYHLRTNKAVDRFLFQEIIRQQIDLKDMAGYTYHGFGGPYLDDFRLIHESFPEMKMVSIERDNDVFRRQRFNRPSGNIKLVHNDLHSFLSRFSAEKKKCIFWLDYTSLEYSQFEEFRMLLEKASSGSIVKITLQAEPRNHHNKSYDAKDEKGNYITDKNEKFRNTFRDVLPDTSAAIPRDPIQFSRLLQDMLHLAAQRSLPYVDGGLNFQPISSFYYKDGVGIFTLTGVVCRSSEKAEIKERMACWKWPNFCWRKDPVQIDIPVLSTKERLHLQSDLPCAARHLIKRLGYKIDGENSLSQMKQYAEFYRQYPYFIRAAV